MKLSNRGQSIVEFMLTLPFALICILVIVEFARMGVKGFAATHAVFQARRESPAKFSLPEGLTEKVLQEGDTPSPYCKGNGEYEICGFAR